MVFRTQDKNIKVCRKAVSSVLMTMLGEQEYKLYDNTQSTVLSAFLGWPLSAWHESQPKALLAQTLPCFPLQDEVPVGT